MNEPQLEELQNRLIDLCPDYTEVRCVHMGKFRTKVNATTYAGRDVTIVIGLSEEEAPAEWARAFAKQLHTVQVT